MNWFKKHKFLTVILVLVLFIIIVSVANGSSKKQDTSKTTATPAASQPKQPAWDAQAIYDQITTGMTRVQAEQIIGKGSGTCTETAMSGVGTLETCNYTGGLGSKGTISVGYLNGVVNTKSKFDF